jgi:antitoxin (DNA-binding transcriptional repressor) of toxin-antitoxin stability system
MKRIKTSELKTHLAHYLRELGEGGEAIEVCVREEPVAYLTSVKGRRAEVRDDAAAEREVVALDERLRAEGLRVDRASWLRNWQVQPAFDMAVPPPVAGDGRTDVSSVEQMRLGAGW